MCCFGWGNWWHWQRERPFTERVTAKPTEAIPLDIPTRQALSRIFGRDAALKVAADGLRWAIGAGQSNPDLAVALNLPGIYQARRGRWRIWILRQNN